MKKLYLILFILILFLTTALIISCNLEEKQEHIKTEINQDSAQTNDLPKEIKYTEDKEITFKKALTSTRDRVGNAVFDIQADINIGKRRNLNNQEQAILTKLTGLLQANKKDILKRTEVGEKSHYADGEKIATSIYHRDIYHKDGEDYYTNEWKFKRKELVNPISLSVGGSGNTGNNNQNSYRVVKVFFELGTSIDHHYSQLKINLNNYDSIVEAVRGIGGRIKIGRAGKFTVSNAIAEGRMRLLNGRVVEHQYYTNTATDRNIPVYINGDTTTLKFYTEDWQDYDFNDSYITVTVKSYYNTQIKFFETDNSVSIVFNEAIQNLLNNNNIHTVGVAYRNNSSQNWIYVEDYQMIIKTNGAFNLGISGLDLNNADFFLFNKTND